MQPTSNSLDLDRLSTVLLEYVLHPTIATTSCLLSVYVVLGNLLVVSAIWHESQLHSVTNYLVASLAVADCLVGAIVMPFSIISEVIMDSWTFGPAWCDLWHSFDVLASTASIMNLCAISLDRYLAITDPISYPTRMTPRYVALLIVTVWTVSSVISFPAIFWWHAVGNGPLEQITPNTTSAISHPSSAMGFNNHSNSARNEILLYRCVFTDDMYYLLFSSFVSFYGPLCVMLYAYYRIYRAAVQQTRFLKHGSKQVMIGRSKKRKRLRNVTETSAILAEQEALCDGRMNEQERLVLRAHRGGGGNKPQSNRPRADTPGTLQNTQEKSASQLNSGSLKVKAITTNNPSSDTDTEQISPSPHRRNYLLSMSRRNKFQIDCQRFDPVTPVEQAQSKDNHIRGEPRKEFPGDSEKYRESRPLINSTEFRRAATPTVLQTNPSAPNLSALSSKEIEQPTIQRPENDSPPTSKGLLKEHCDRNGFESQAVSADARLRNVANETTESFSNSSGSYGTGSIASVLARPAHRFQTATIQESTRDETSDILVEALNKNSRLRRALSVNDSARKCSKMQFERRRINGQHRSPQGRARQRSSCSDPSSQNDLFHSITSSRGLKILSKVRISRTSSNQEPKVAIPPPSLLPLMMMNSDTSTDSSVTTCVPKTAKLPSDTDEKASNAPSQSSKTEAITCQKSRRHSLGSHTTSGPLISSLIRDKNLPSTKDAKSGQAQGRAQMLYYDSDKLIQSIVDLKAIEYIDDPDNNRKNTVGEQAILDEDESKSMSSCRTNRKPNEESAGQISLSEEQANLARQNRSMGKKLSKLAKERKAAKTLGIVMGVFILCWLPFFAVNVLLALCDCKEGLKPVHTVVTWLGWLNSAMNPVIYACWSRDFRRAFRRVLCSWVEFICPYERVDLARRLKLKKGSKFSAQDTYFSRNISSIKGHTSTCTSRSAATVNCVAARSLLSD